jgi:hypothetical protein
MLNHKTPSMGIPFPIQQLGVMLTRLLRRVQRYGLTAIVGPPQIGKSWLLMELAYRLDRETDPRCLVGFTRSPKGENDPLLSTSPDRTYAVALWTK